MYHRSHTISKKHVIRHAFDIVLGKGGKLSRYPVICLIKTLENYNCFHNTIWLLLCGGHSPRQDNYFTFNMAA